LFGFSYGAHLPGFGGYVCYIGVDPVARGRGVGVRLMEQMFKVLAADAGANDESLPFVVWESHRPAEDAPAEDWQLWEARMRLFERVGGYWVDGLELQTPNYGEEETAVPLQLFVRPVEKAVNSFTADDLRQVACGLLERVYRMQPGEALYDATLAGATAPRLRLPRESVRGVRPAMLVAAS
jgi:hypothetical protein